MEFPSKASETFFFKTFDRIDVEIDVHIKNAKFKKYINLGLLYIAGHYFADGWVLLKLTEKGKHLIRNRLDGFHSDMKPIAKIAGNEPNIMKAIQTCAGALRHRGRYAEASEMYQRLNNVKFVEDAMQIMSDYCEIVRI